MIVDSVSDTELWKNYHKIPESYHGMNYQHFVPQITFMAQVTWTGSVIYLSTWYSATGSKPSFNKGPHRRKFMLQNVDSRFFTCVNSAADSTRHVWMGEVCRCSEPLMQSFGPQPKKRVCPLEGCQRSRRSCVIFKTWFCTLLCRTAITACYFSVH